MDSLPNPLIYATDDSGCLAEPFEYDFGPSDQPLHQPSLFRQFAVRDTGNASARHIRSTLCGVPERASLCSDLSLPLGYVWRPLAPAYPGESGIIHIKAPDEGPPRCTRCRAYLSPFVEKSPNGKDGSCPFCSMTNAIPPPVEALDGEHGFRVTERPELVCGTYEYIIGNNPLHVIDSSPFSQKTYEEEPKTQPGVDVPMDKACLPYVVCVVIEATSAVTKTDIFRSYIDGIKTAIHQMNDDTRLSIMVVDDCIQMLDMRGAVPMLAQVPSADPPFVPMPLMSAAVRLGDYREQLDAALDVVVHAMATSRATTPHTVAAIRLAAEMMRLVGGRVVAAVAQRPCAGPGALKPRPAMEGQKSDHLLMLPVSDKWYTHTRDFCRKWNITVDILGVGPDPLDLATLDTLCSGTGGQLHYIRHRNASSNCAARVRSLIAQLVGRTHARAVMMRVRCSRGLAVNKWYTPLTFGDHEQFAAGLDSGQSVAFDVTWEDKVLSGLYSFMQAAVAFTAEDGTRRLRVSTLRLPILRDQTKIYKSGDGATLAAYVVRKSLSLTTSQGIPDVRSGLGDALVGPLVHFRLSETPGSEPSTTMWTMPQCLSMLPIMCYSLGKTAALHPKREPSEGGAITVDERLASARMLATCTAERLAWMSYPQVFSLEEGEVRPMRLNSSLHEDLTGMVLLIVMGTDAWIRIGRKTVTRPYIGKVFQPSPDPVNHTPTIIEGAINLRATPEGEVVQATIDYVRELHRLDGLTFGDPGVIWEGNSEDFRAHWAFVEDRTRIDQNYQDFLTTCHKTVMKKVEQHSYIH